MRRSDSWLWLCLLVSLVLWHGWALFAVQPRPLPLQASETRKGWHQAFPAPELLGGKVPAPQGLTFLDAETALLGVHAGELAVLYRIDVASGKVTGRAESRSVLHLNGLRRRSNGEVWAVAVLPSEGWVSRAVRVDLDASFRTGEITVTARWDFGDSRVGMGLAFLDVDGTEYLLCQQWGASGNPLLYVFRADQLGEKTTREDRVARFDLGLLAQDIAVAPDGRVFVSRNSLQGSRDGHGWLQAYDVASALRSLPDGAKLAPLGAFEHATKMAEGLDFHPVTGQVWAATEGRFRVGDSWSHAAVWTAPLSALRTL